MLGGKSSPAESTYMSKASGVKGDGLSDRTIVEVLQRILICNLSRLIILDDFVGTGQRALENINNTNPLLTGFSKESFKDILESDTSKHSTFKNGITKLLNSSTTSTLQSKIDPKRVSSSISRARDDQLKESSEYRSFSQVHGHIAPFSKREAINQPSIPITLNDSIYMMRSLRAARYDVGVCGALNVAARRIKKEMWELLTGPTGLQGGVMFELLEEVRHVLGKDFEVFVFLALKPAPNQSIEAQLKASSRLNFQCVIGLARINTRLEMTQVHFVASGMQTCLITCRRQSIPGFLQVAEI